MTSKEALEKVIDDISLEWGYEGIEDELREKLKPLYEDLNRLEELRDLYEIATKGNWKLKEENTKLKNKNTALEIWNDCYTKENSKLKKAIEIILKYKINPSTFIFTRKIYKESCGKDLTFEKAHSLLEFNGTQEEYDLLKDILGE